MWQVAATNASSVSGRTLNRRFDSAEIKSHSKNNDWKMSEHVESFS